VAATESDVPRSHQKPQISCFGPDGLLRRHDVTIDISAGNRAALRRRLPRHRRHHHPTTRRGYAWPGDYQLVPEPLLVAIDMGEITIR
jgi:hypothetical protein